MLRYESLILATPEITNDEAATIEKAIATAINNAKGGVISFERWGKYRLAYPVNKHEYGVYYLARYEVSEQQTKALMQEISEMLAVRFNNIVMRSMTSSLDPKRGLEYTRPQSLEEAPHEGETFLKEHPMGSWNRGTKATEQSPAQEVNNGQED